MGRSVCRTVWSVPFLLLFPRLGGGPENPEENLPPPAAVEVDFKRHVEPILAESCYHCHGPNRQRGGLRLDSREEALKGGYSGPVIVPGESAASRLIHVVAGLDFDVLMPESGDLLSEEQIALLRAWIDQGVPWPRAMAAGLAEDPGVNLDSPEPGQDSASEHWAFRRPVRPDPPEVRNEGWVRNPIDRFILARLEKEGASPSPPADRATLMRRVSLDLIGLPPSPQEVQDFLMDNRSQAYEALVDRLLASPHFGEKWALHWLDLARYADSDGYEKDWPRPHAWRYRKWVIDALNQNKRFDQFTIEQLAGDLLPGATLEQKIATGFHRNTLTNREGGIDLEEFRIEAVVDRTSTTAETWLGLTLACARCHDHKYDPISQKDFYRMMAFFNTSREVNIEAPLPGEMGPYLVRRAEFERKRAELLGKYGVPPLMAEWEEELLRADRHPGERPGWDVAWDTVGKLVDYGHDVVRKGPEKRTPKEQEALEDHFVEWYNLVVSGERYKELGFRDLRQELEALHREYPGLSEAQILVEEPGARRTHILLRGDYQQPGIEVEPGVPEILPLVSAHDGPLTRLTLARWLVSTENPLTARVATNRLWQAIFGAGLAATSGDFGLRSEPPSHPELLDWLATEFMTDWDIKRTIRLIVTSATYRQCSQVRPELREKDPQNRLLASMPRLRLPAELVRDSALKVSGLLDPTVGGRSIRPPLPEGVTQLGFGSSVKWEPSEGPERYRRGLYVFFQRTVPYPQLHTFDAPDRLMSCTRREQSVTPLQALTLLNDPVFFEAAQALALRLIRETPDSVEGRLAHGFRLCLSRNPTPAEKKRLQEFYAEQKRLLSERPESVSELFPPQRIQGVDPFEAAVWVAVSRVLLNLDEFITRE